MRRFHNFGRDMARLQDAQRRTHERMAAEQARIDQRFDQIRERLEQKYGQASDSQQRIVAAALELLRTGGLANISLRKLAEMVHMRAPALYWHFKDKEELVDYMAEAILAREFTDLQPMAPGDNWQDWLERQMLRLRGAMLAFPDGARVVAGAHLYPALTLARFSEACLASLTSAGLPLRQAHDIVLTATHYTFGHVIEEQAAPTPEQLAAFDMRTFLEPYPTLAAAIETTAADDGDPHRDFRTGLRYIMAGAGK